VWFFVFPKNRRFWEFQKHSESKELAGLWCLKHSSIKEPSVLGISKTLGEPSVFVKDFF